MAKVVSRHSRWLVLAVQPSLATLEFVDPRSKKCNNTWASWRREGYAAKTVSPSSRASEKHFPMPRAPATPSAVFLPVRVARTHDRYRSREQSRPQSRPSIAYCRPFGGCIAFLPRLDGAPVATFFFSGHYEHSRTVISMRAERFVQCCKYLNYPPTNSVLVPLFQVRSQSLCNSFIYHPTLISEWVTYVLTLSIGVNGKYGSRGAGGENSQSIKRTLSSRVETIDYPYRATPTGRGRLLIVLSLGIGM